jgi:hypothetical protein
MTPLLKGKYEGRKAQIAQLAERVLGKDEVGGSNPLLGSRIPQIITTH